MIFRKLGNSDLKVSLLGYGAWALGEEGWKDVNTKEAIKTFEYCLENGINFIDTAPIYGMGLSEERIGNILNGFRENVIIASKCGLLWDENKSVYKDISRDGIMQDIENSLKRLKTDYIDLYQIHWLDGKTPLKESLETLNKLKKDGVIKNIGVCNFNKEELQEGIETAEIVSVQNQYNLLQNSAEEYVLPFCRENNISFIPYSPLAQGLLSGKINKNYTLTPGDIREYNPLFNNKENFKKAITKIKTLEKPLSHTAIKYLASREEVSSIIISVTKLNHLKENLEAIKQIE